jgi:purine nucleosidase
MDGKRILIDTDPGVDDSMMLQCAFKSPEIHVEAITTVFGNNTVDITSRNALKNLQVAGRETIPVARGARKPLVRPHNGQYPVQVHGEDGLGNSQLPLPQGGISPMPAAMLIVERVRQFPGEITLLAVGPLTNLALAVSLDPAMTSLVKEVVLMGGAATVPGNVSPTAEANMYHDPEAARIVLHAGWPVTMVGLDVTTQTRITADFWDEMHQAGTHVTHFLSAITKFYIAYYRDQLGEKTMPVHDASALAYILDDSLFTSKNAYVDVEVSSELTRGETVVDFRQQGDQRTNAKICLSVDSSKLLAMYLERITAP